MKLWMLTGIPGEPAGATALVWADDPDGARTLLKEELGKPARVCREIYRKVTPGVAYCCSACQVSASDHAPWEVGPYDPEGRWPLVHSEYCEARKAERGECTPAEAVALARR